MVTFENRCAGCDGAAYPCSPETCGLSHFSVLKCDWCGDEVEDLYEIDDMQLCEDCLLHKFAKHIDIDSINYTV